MVSINVAAHPLALTSLLQTFSHHSFLLALTVAHSVCLNDLVTCYNHNANKVQIQKEGEAPEITTITLSPAMVGDMQNEYLKVWCTATQDIMMNILESDMVEQPYQLCPICIVPVNEGKSPKHKHS